jgi:hypothetical protein
MKYLVMLEPLEERYTKQRQEWLEKNAVGCSFIYGEQLTTKIEVGSVLDAFWTNYYKFSQLMKITEMLRSGVIKRGDELWFADLRFPWIEAIKYMTTLAKIDITISGVLHAGTRDRDDFTFLSGMKDRARGFEHTIFDMVDEIHLGSEYHKKIIMEDMGKRYAQKLLVTGLFFEPEYILDRAVFKMEDERENLVVFPHRIAPEKKPELFDKLAGRLSDTKYKFVKTMEVTSNKQEYYELLSKAKYAVSFDGQETFGYSILECMTLWVTPLVFNGKSYQDTVLDPKYRRDYLSEVEDIIRLGWYREPADYINVTNYAKRYLTEDVLKRMRLI